MQSKPGTPRSLAGTRPGARGFGGAPHGGWHRLSRTHVVERGHPTSPSRGPRGQAGPPRCSEVRRSAAPDPPRESESVGVRRGRELDSIAPGAMDGLGRRLRTSLRIKRGRGGQCRADGSRGGAGKEDGSEWAAGRGGSR